MSPQLWERVVRSGMKQRAMWPSRSMDHESWRLRVGAAKTLAIQKKMSQLDHSLWTPGLWLESQASKQESSVMCMHWCILKIADPAMCCGSSESFHLLIYDFKMNQEHQDNNSCSTRPLWENTQGSCSSFIIKSIFQPGKVRKGKLLVL